jgi:hypothetical protein
MAWTKSKKKTENQHNILLKQNDKRPFEDLGINVWIILQWIFETECLKM